MVSKNEGNPKGRRSSYVDNEYVKGNSLTLIEFKDLNVSPKDIEMQCLTLSFLGLER